MSSFTVVGFLLRAASRGLSSPCVVLGPLFGSLLGRTHTHGDNRFKVEDDLGMSLLSSGHRACLQQAEGPAGRRYEEAAACHPLALCLQPSLGKG